MRLPGSTLALGTAYKPENVAIQDLLDVLSDSLSLMARCDLTCVLGDFNVDMSNAEHSKAKQILQFCHHYSLEQLVTEPTRITDTSGTILDLVMISDDSKCKNVEIIHNPCLSDHALVLTGLDVKKPKLKKRVKMQRSVNNINFDALSRLETSSVGLYKCTWKS